MFGHYLPNKNEGATVVPKSKIRKLNKGYINQHVGAGHVGVWQTTIHQIFHSVHAHRGTPAPRTVPRHVIDVSHTRERCRRVAVGLPAAL